MTNFGVGEHPSNIEIVYLNITKLSTYVKRLIIFFIFLFNYLLNILLPRLTYLQLFFKFLTIFISYDLLLLFINFYLCILYLIFGTFNLYLHLLLYSWKLFEGYGKFLFNI